MKKLINLRYPFHGTFNFKLKMRITTLLLIVSLFQIQANTYSQNTKISLDMQQVSIEEVLGEIETRTDFKFLVDTREVDLNRIVSIKVKKKKIQIF